MDAGITKIVVSGSDRDVSIEIVDDIFAALKSKGRPAIFVDNYEDGERSYVVTDEALVVVCLKK